MKSLYACRPWYRTTSPTFSTNNNPSSTVNPIAAYRSVLFYDDLPLGSASIRRTEVDAADSRQPRPLNCMNHRIMCAKSRIWESTLLPVIHLLDSFRGSG